MKSKKIKDKLYHVFEDENEFLTYFGKDAPPLVRNWKEGQEGDYVLADDGGVIEIIRRGDLNHPHNRKNYKYYVGYIRTVVGSFTITKKSTMDTDFTQHMNRYTFSKTIRQPQKRVYEREHVTKNERLFAMDVAVGRGAVKSAMEAYGITDLAKARKKALILLKQERIVAEIKNNIKDVLREKGVNDEFIIQGMLDLYDQGRAEAELGVAFKSLKELGIMNDTIKSKTNFKQLGTGVVGLFQGFSKEEPEELPDVTRPGLVEPEEGQEDAS